MPTYNVKIPVEAYVIAEVYAESEEAAIQEVDDNTAKYILANDDSVEVLEFDHRGEIEIDE